jgi:hypothetical protein
MKRLPVFQFLIYTAIFVVILSSFTEVSVWGFFGHRRINRMAVFTVPSELIPLYKKNIEYITEHAVDPDKRRYSTKHEAVRHYIDLDHWGKGSFDHVPQNFTDALIKFGKLWQVHPETGDSTLLCGTDQFSLNEDQLITNSLNVSYTDYKDFFDAVLMPEFYEDEMKAKAEQLNIYCSDAIDPSLGDLVFENAFAEYGILPYHLMRMQERLTDAFFELDAKNIIRLSADLGHYIADAHVPLHTTENYNGQLTNQDGIHAFWESRLPELFADDSYDYLVGRAEYIDNAKDYYWNVIYDSHSYLDSVLAIENKLSNSFPSDLQYCYEDRNNYTVRLQCEEYSEAYHRDLDGMVEQQMRKSIQAVGSAWYTAWVDAGQPDLEDIFNPIQLSEEDLKELDRQERLYEEGNIQGRKHDN